MGSSSCGQAWRGRNGRGSSGRLGRSRQQRGSGLAGAHWSMLNRGADEVGSKRQQVTWASGLVRSSTWCGVRGGGWKGPFVLYTEQDPGLCEGTAFRCPEKAPLESQEGMIRPHGGAWQHNLGGVLTPRFPVLPDFSFSASYNTVGKPIRYQPGPAAIQGAFSFSFSLLLVHPVGGINYIWGRML